MRRNPLQFLEEVASYGPVAQFRIGPQLDLPPQRP